MAHIMLLALEQLLVSLQELADLTKCTKLYILFAWQLLMKII